MTITKPKNTWEVSPYQHHQRQGGETSHGCGETREDELREGMISYPKTNGKRP